MSAIDTWVEDFGSRAAHLAGASVPWLDTLRRQSIERFAAEGWPTRRLENWRHTSLAFMEQQSFSAPVAPLDPAQTLARLRGSDNAKTDGHWMVFVGGRHAPALSSIGALPAGASIESLADALNDPQHAIAADIEEAFGKLEDGDSPAALNTAFASDGALIRLARGVAVEAPIHLVFIAGPDDSTRHLRNLIVADAGAQATIVEHYPDGGAAATLTTVATRLRAGADAHITHMKLQQESAQAIHIATIDAFQSRGSVFASHSLSFGARLARNDIRTRFEGEACETLFNGLYHVDERRHVDHQTLIEHAQPRGTSREFYRGLLDGSSRGVFAGRIVVARDAQRSDATQRCDNLLLSRMAEADARPELEIYADDVKCAHGATVGQMDEDSLFYLRTRGLDEGHARQLLTYAFAAEALARIGLVPLREHARAALLARLPWGERLEEVL